MKTYETLKLEHVSDHVMVVTLDRPEARNAMNTQMGLDLRDLWQDIYIEQGDLRCIVVTGTGDKAFCAGGDLKERNGMTDAQWQRQHAIFEQAMLALLEVPVPVIAAVNGLALDKHQRAFIPGACRNKTGRRYRPWVFREQYVSGNLFLDKPRIRFVLIEGAD